MDPAVGILVNCKVGDPVRARYNALCTVLHNSEERFEQARQLILEAYTIGPQPLKDERKLVYRVIGDRA